MSELDEREPTDLMGFPASFIEQLRALTLTDIENEKYAFCYIVILICSLTVIVFKFIPKLELGETSKAYDDLCKAITRNDTDMCIRIINKYPRMVNMFCNDSQYTPFLRACLAGNMQLVRFMITQGADVNLKSISGETPFYLATYNHVKHPELRNATCLHTLFYAGSDVNQTNAKGLTPLQLASYFGHLGLVKWLLKKGAHLDVTPDPYTLAQKRGHIMVANAIQRALNIDGNIT